MKTFGLLSLIMSLMMTNWALAEEPVASMDDLRVLTGESWSGSLTYLDYGSGRRVSIPVDVKIDAPGRSTLKYAIRYPGEEEHNARERLKISGKGRKINGEPITRREQAADGTITLTTIAEGKDDNRKADIQMVYVIAPNQFRILKNVRFSAEEGFFNRNEFNFER
jgi:hypothetical protein